MFIERVKSQGLAHLSYVVGSQAQAAVIDPRRDIDVYLDIASSSGCKITHVFETHRNEDLVSGAAELAALTGAEVLHGPNAAGDVVYAQTTHEGDEFAIGNVSLRVLETPGHTDDSISIAAYDNEFKQGAVAVFTGDALFVGDVGRTDFYPDRAHEVAGALYDSLRKITALGEQTILHPAHGAGSVCGSGMADRDVSTLGHELMNNPRLQITDKNEFIEAKVAEHHLKPPYFKLMEALNLEGAQPRSNSAALAPLSLDEFKRLQRSSTLVDVRNASAYLGAHVNNSLSLPTGLLSSFAGWLLEAGQELTLIAQDADQAKLAADLLARIGYDKLNGFLVPSLFSWAANGEPFGNLPTVDASFVQQRLENRSDPVEWELLDVRDSAEFADVSIPGARQLFVGDIPNRFDELDRNKAYTVMCGSGARATIAASVLLREGFENIDLFLGSMAAWRSKSLPVS